MSTGRQIPRATVEVETLTDDSRVYNVVISATPSSYEMTIYCDSEQRAHALADAFNATAQGATT